MFKSKYQFNPDTLSYKKVEFNFVEDFLKKILSQTGVSILIGVGLFLVAFNTIDSPKLQKLKSENRKILLKYEILQTKLDNSSGLLAEIQNRDDFKYRPIFEADPIPKTIRNAGSGGSDQFEHLKEYYNSEVLIKMNMQVSRLSKQLYVQSKSYDDLVKRIKDKDKMLSCIPAIRPIAGKDLTRFGSPFGMRMHPILKYRRMHEGVDLTAPQGTKVFAAGDGYVSRAGWNGGLGENIILDHGYSYKTVYGHLSKLLVKEGQRVKRGDVIGLVGNTGLSTSAHLHYEVRKNNEPVNPVNFYYNDLSDEEYDSMIENSESANTHVFEK